MQAGFPAMFSQLRALLRCHTFACDLTSPAMIPKQFVPFLTLAFLAANGCVTSQNTTSRGVNIAQQDGKLAIEVGGQPFGDYHYQNVPRPYLYPLLGPGGEMLTRHWPMKDVPGEERDHVHHRSLWFTHGDVNGHDFWAETPKSGKIVHQEFQNVKSGRDVGSFTEKNNWVTVDGKLICSETRTIRIYNRRPGERMLDFDVTIHAVNGAVKFGDTKEGSMAVRMAETMRVTMPKNQPGRGHIVNSEGVRDKDTWGKRAKWCYYYGPVEGKTLGIAMFDHPSNPKHPTWWHVRDYGLFAANPFGVHDFEKKPAGTGDFTIPAG
jgi:hypothetical protein